MYAKQINKDFADLPLVEALAKKAFPPEEYLPTTELCKMVEQRQVDFWGLYEENTFIGFMVISQYNNMCYLFFLAIEPNARSCGYGSRTLQLINDLYPSKQQVVDIEKLDGSAPNNAQRISRKSFYMRNGYKETGKCISYLGVDYEILCKTDSFDFDTFRQLINRFNLKNFTPKYFEIYYSH